MVSASESSRACFRKEALSIPSNRRPTPCWSQRSKISGAVTFTKHPGGHDACGGEKWFGRQRSCDCSKKWPGVRCCKCAGDATRRVLAARRSCARFTMSYADLAHPRVPRFGNVFATAMARRSHAIGTAAGTQKIFAKVAEALSGRAASDDAFKALSKSPRRVGHSLPQWARPPVHEFFAFATSMSRLLRWCLRRSKHIHRGEKSGVTARKPSGRFSFDDLLTRLHRALHDDPGSPHNSPSDSQQP